MSDVSGIPYMGPMGMGNFFASPYPALSGGGTMSANQISQPYAPEIAYNQNVVNNLFNTGGGGGGFGKATDYYSQLGANYSAAGMSPYGVFGPGGGGISYQGGASGAPVASINNDAWSQSIQGPNWGGGSGFSSGGFGGFGGGGGAPAIDWSNLFSGGGGGGGLGSSGFNPGNAQNWAGNWNMPQTGAADFGAGMFGGLAGGMGPANQGPNNQVDWSTLFGGGGAQQPQQPQQPAALDAPMPGAPSSTSDWTKLFGGGTGADPAPGMTMPGGLNSPMTVPEQQAPAYDYGSLFGKGTGGAPPPAPDGTRTYDFAPMFEGGGGGFGTGGSDTSQLFGAAAPSPGGDAFSYNKDPMWTPETSPGTSADAMAEQARARLAGVMGSGDTEPVEPGVSPGEAAVPEPAAEPPAASGVPLPRARPAGADAPRPPETVPPAAPPVEPPAPLPKGAARPPARVAFTVEPGKEERVAGVNPRLRTAVEGGAQFLPPGYSVEVFSGVRYDSPEHKQAYHRIIDGSGRAMDVRIIGPDGPITPEGNDYTGMYTLLARGVKTWTAQNDPGAVSGYGGAFASDKTGRNPDLMHFDQGPNRGSLRPDVQFNTLRPLSGVEQNAMPAYIPILGENQVPLDRPVPLGAGYSAPVPPLTDRALPTVEPYRAPGMSARDFAAPARFGGDTGDPSGYRSRYAGRIPETAPSTSAPSDFEGFRKSGDIIDLRAEPGRGRLELGMRLGMAPPNPGIDPFWTSDPDAIARAYQDTPLSRQAGLDDLKAQADLAGEARANEAALNGPTQFMATDGAEAGRNALANVVGPRSSAFGFDPGGYGEGGYGNAFEPVSDAGFNALDAAAASNSGFSRYNDEGYGTGTGRSPPVTLSPEHMRTMEEIESHQNPRLHDPGSSYKGLYQLSDSEFRKYGGTGSIFNAEQNTKAATAKMYAEGQRAQDILGRALTPVEQYMVHQQGLAGTLSHLANPDQPAWKSFQQASQWSDAKAKTAIWGNLSNDQKAQFGNDVNSITSRDFINLWTTMYYQKMVESGLSPGGLSDLP